MPMSRRQRGLVLPDPGRTVIQLPQSLQFNDPSNLRRTAQVIARHKSLFIDAVDVAL
jgi:exopolysaccharide biosynthesis predicted pyruvyltransferase EpsI